MTMTASFAKVTALALPLGLMTSAGHAANLVDTAGKMAQLGTFSDAVAAAGLEEKLAGEGPFTVFAPSDQAFEQLPQPLLSKLLEEGHQAELTKLIEHHIVVGKAISAKDVSGQETELDTAAGDQLTVDGTGSVVLLIPTGMTVARAGDQVMVEQSAAVAVAPSVEVEPGEDAERTEVTEGSDMPASEHQEEVLGSDTATEARQTAPEGGMPATPHQEQVLAAGETPGAGDLVRQASVVESDVTADNGVIHVIDAVLVPQDLAATLEKLKGGS